jgi:hypothetical protein
VNLLPSRKARENLLGFYGPISLLVLIGVWAVGLVVGFGLMQFGAGSAVNTTGGQPGLSTDFYLSGTTFFTLGLGDVVPRSGLARVLVVVEAGFGFGFLAAIIGYLPFIYGSFSKREVEISLLDSRCAELMESHLSYPVLAYFKSQHDNQSWIAALTAILDACALLKVGIEGACERQAELTFAIARHAVADLAQVFGTPPRALPYERLSAVDAARLRATLAEQGLRLRDTQQAQEELTAMRSSYEPYVYALATYLNQTLPPWIPEGKGKDNWQTTAWGEAAGLVRKNVETVAVDDHF